MHENRKISGWWSETQVCSVWAPPASCEPVLLNPAFALCPRSGLVFRRWRRDRFGCSRGW
jgi:hypothetical protein